MTSTETEAPSAERAALARDYESLGERLARRGVEIDRVKEKAAAFGVAVPSWGVGTGGTRFARFPGAGEPRGVFDKLDDCAVIHRLTGATPTAMHSRLCSTACRRTAGSVWESEPNL